mmetsp:Transcript_10616/g.21006  ORF Transcript_10616/g.21006 Transcript_10616/m.21006 type:complete len:249 (-) Transcript_10616:243-989(-)
MASALWWWCRIGTGATTSLRVGAQAATAGWICAWWAAAGGMWPADRCGIKWIFCASKGCSGSDWAPRAPLPSRCPGTACRDKATPFGDRACTIASASCCERFLDAAALGWGAHDSAAALLVWILAARAARTALDGRPRDAGEAAGAACEGGRLLFAGGDACRDAAVELRGSDPFDDVGRASVIGLMGQRWTPSLRHAFLIAVGDTPSFSAAVASGMWESSFRSSIVTITGCVGPRLSCPALRRGKIML